MKSVLSGRLRTSVDRFGNLLIAAAFALSGLMPIVLFHQANAQQLTLRKVTISSSQPDLAGVTYDFAFTTATTSTIQSMIFQFCSRPLGTCTLPGTDSTPAATETIDVHHTTTSVGTPTGFTGATAFTEQTSDAGACTDADGGSGVSTMYCVTRTDTTSETAGARTFQILNVTNPIIAQTPTAKNNEEIYVRVTTYSDTAFATKVDEGTVAASIVNQLTVTGRIQERLVFCVFALDDAAGSSATVGTASGNQPKDCSAAEANVSTTIDLGVIDNLAISYTPENNNPPTDLGNDRFGAAIVTTNASNGLAVTYYATAAGTGTNELRAFRVPGATCNVSGTSLVDQCFISADDTTPDTFVAGTERFGMQLACVSNTDTATTTRGLTSNLGKDATPAYVSGSGSNGSVNSVYDAGRTNFDDDATDDCENDPAGTFLNDEFGWRDSGTAQPLISSLTVVDNEMIKLRHAAAAAATTPTGTYTVNSTFIATPTY